MAQYFHLNIYKTTFDFLTYYAKIFPNFQRVYRYTLGETILTKITDFSVLIYEANNAKTNENRLNYLNEMNNTLQRVSILLRLCCEVKAVSKEKYINCAKFIQSIEKQLNGWLSYTINKIQTNSQEFVEEQTVLN